jgi:blue light- and temperature-responsive anti-repressor
MPNIGSSDSEAASRLALPMPALGRLAMAGLALESATSIYQVAYWSRNRITGGSRATMDAVRDILAVSRRNNQRLGITGVLLISQGYFAQLLEGTRPAVESLLDRIMRDRRHSDIVTVHERSAGPRDFASWSMAFVRQTAMQDIVIEPSDADPVSLGLSREGSSLLEMLRYLVREQPATP